MLIVCFASIDQYLSTSYTDRLQRLSTLKLARYLVIYSLIAVLVYCIPVLIFWEIDPNIGCKTINLTFNYYLSVVHAYILFGVVPIIVSLTFSLLAYKNVRRRLDRQLTAMVLLRCSLYIITTTIYVSIRTYLNFYSINYNDSLAVAINNLISMTATCIYNLNFSVVKLTVLFYIKIDFPIFNSE